MKISTTAAAAASANVDLLAVAVAKPVKLEGAAAELDRALDGAVSRLVKANEIRGGAGQVTLLHKSPGGGGRAGSSARRGRRPRRARQGGCRGGAQRRRGRRPRPRLGARSNHRVRARRA